MNLRNMERWNKMQDKRILCVRCPFCHEKTRVKVYADTVVLNFPLYCPKCKRETKVNIVQLKTVISDEPDA